MTRLNALNHNPCSTHLLGGQPGANNLLGAPTPCSKHTCRLPHSQRTRFHEVTTQLDQAQVQLTEERNKSAELIATLQDGARLSRMPSGRAMHCVWFCMSLLVA